MLISKRMTAVFALSTFGWAISASSIQAQQPGTNDVGNVVFVFGTANLKRSSVVPLTKGLGLQARDKVTTGSNGRAQLRMIDNSKIALRPGTEFVVQQLVKAKAAEDAVVVGDKRDDKAVFQLLKGGLRTLTGDIGGKEEGEYQLITPVATIGIRGTAYSAVMADPSECVKAGGSPGKSKVALYVTVSGGAIYVENEAGRLNLDPSEFGCVTGVDSSPVLLLRPPEALTAEARALGGIGEGDDEKSGKGDNEEKFTPTTVRTRPPGATTDFNNGNDIVSTQSPIEFDEPVIPLEDEPVVTRSITAALPFSVSDDLVFAQRSQPGSVEVDGNGNLTRVDAINGDTYGIGSSTNVNTGQASDIRWGRWSGGSAEVTPSTGGPATNVDLTDSSLHWVVGPEGSGDVVIPITGTRSFTVVGNTSPTDGNMNVGTFGNATLSADFGAASVQTDVNFSLNGEVWTGNTGTGAINGSTFSGNYADVTVGPAGGNLRQGTGEFSGFFTTGADAAGLSYGLTDDNGPSPVTNRASGVVVFTGN